MRFRIGPAGVEPPCGLVDPTPLPNDALYELVCEWFGRTLSREECFFIAEWPLDEVGAYASPVRH